MTCPLGVANRSALMVSIRNRAPSLHREWEDYLPRDLIPSLETRYKKFVDDFLAEVLPNNGDKIILRCFAMRCLDANVLNHIFSFLTKRDVLVRCSRTMKLFESQAKTYMKLRQNQLSIIPLPAIQQLSTKKISRWTDDSIVRMGPMLLLENWDEIHQLGPQISEELYLMAFKRSLSEGSVPKGLDRLINFWKANLEMYTEKFLDLLTSLPLFRPSEFPKPDYNMSIILEICTSMGDIIPLNIFIQLLEILLTKVHRRQSRPKEDAKRFVTFWKANRERCDTEFMKVLESQSTSGRVNLSIVVYIMTEMETQDLPFSTWKHLFQQSLSRDAKTLEDLLVFWGKNRERYDQLFYPAYVDACTSHGFVHNLNIVFTKMKNVLDDLGFQLLDVIRMSLQDCSVIEDTGKDLSQNLVTLFQMNKDCHFLEEAGKVLEECLARQIDEGECDAMFLELEKLRYLPLNNDIVIKLFEKEKSELRDFPDDYIPPPSTPSVRRRLLTRAGKGVLNGVKLPMKGGFVCLEPLGFEMIRIWQNRKRKCSGNRFGKDDVSVMLSNWDMLRDRGVSGRDFHPETKQTVLDFFHEHNWDFTRPSYVETIEKKLKEFPCEPVVKKTKSCGRSRRSRIPRMKAGY